MPACCVPVRVDAAAGGHSAGSCSGDGADEGVGAWLTCGGAHFPLAAVGAEGELLAWHSAVAMDEQQPPPPPQREEEQNRRPDEHSRASAATVAGSPRRRQHRSLVITTPVRVEGLPDDALVSRAVSILGSVPFD
jgi:hypothetical protein